MKANGNGNLQKFYGHLAARERMAALIEAIARGDTQEADALTDSAPHKTYEIPHHRREVEAIIGLTLSYAINQLTTGLRLMVLVAWSKPDADGTEVDEEAFDAARTYAFKASELAYAWEDLCKELGIAERTVTKLTDAQDEIETILAVARTIVPTPEQAAAIWKAKWGIHEVPTREARLITLRNTYNEIALRRKPF
jgi:hypothetical protein